VVREVTDYDDYEGRIAAVDMVEVRARVRGHLVKVNFHDGQIVKDGDLLYEIDPRTYKASLDAAKAQFASAQASQKLAKSEHERAKKLAAKGAGSKQDEEVWEAKTHTTAADTLKAAAEVDRAQLDFDFTKVSAPITGKISRSQVSVGNLVNTGGGETLLTTITSVDPMYVYFDVDERALLRYRREFEKSKTNEGGPRPPIKELKIPVLVGLEGDEGYPHKGVIDFADNKVNPSTGTIQVRAVLENDKRILDAGMRARVRLPVGKPHKVHIVPESAIGTDQGRKFVYVVNSQDIVERHDVKVGRIIESMQVIEGGLKPDAWVIVNGIQRVRDGIKVVPRHPEQQ
jgi:RND family efflux transporter MFP subunit